MTQFRETKRIQVFSAAAANGVGTALDESKDFIKATGFRNLNFTTIAANSADMTVKVQGAMYQADGTLPDFSAAASVANPYDFLNIVDLQDEGPLNGDTGVVFTGATDGVRQFLVNVDTIDAINFQISSFVAGDVTVNTLSTTNA